MVAVNIYEAKTHLSRLLRRVRAGEEIVIADHGVPVARLVPVAPRVGPRVLGADEGSVFVADDFDAPLPDDVVAAFYAGPVVPPAESAARQSAPSRPRPAGKAARKRSPAR